MDVRLVARALAVLGCLAFSAACDRQPSAAGASSGVQPILVEQARAGPFAVERQFTGQVRARGEVWVVVREPGEVVEVSAPGDSQPVAAGEVLLRLRSPDLELEAAEARSWLETREAAYARLRQLADVGLAPQTELEEGLAAVEQARFRCQRVDLRRARLEVEAPASGVLLARALPEPGQWCASGTEVARIIDTSRLVVEVAVPAAWSSGVAGVQNAVLGLGDQGEGQAEVVSLSAEVDEERGGRILTLRPQSSGSLVADALVTVRLQIQARERALTVPVGALVTDDEGGYRVAVGPAAGEQGAVRWVDVVPGPSDGRVTVIEDGLDEGAWVVLASEVEDTRWWGPEIFLGVGK